MVVNKKRVSRKTRIRDIANEAIRCGSFWSLLESSIGVSGYVLANSLGISHGKYAGFKRGGMFHPQYLIRIAKVWKDRITEDEIFTLLEEAQFRNII